MLKENGISADFGSMWREQGTSYFNFDVLKNSPPGSEREPPARDIPNRVHLTSNTISEPGSIRPQRVQQLDTQ